MVRNYIRWGAILMLLAVALGAFGAHMLDGRIDEDMLSAYKTGVQYHIAHALGLLIIGVLADKLGHAKRLSLAGLFIGIGIILFSGSLYVMALTGVRVLGAITPIGGVSFMIGWALLAAAAVGKRD
ncbi:MAG: hypothetical protein K0Q59_5223 [Paenibacillus sp.]|jgi:uncharacterized membrane protein YgdD (TMEM256/DUF423 family)|nr:hypothetical protein [Paenibacillus sp.]